MSRAFVKETAESAAPPERMVEEGPNPVTPEGHAKLVAEVARLEAALKSETNPLLRETLARDLRYFAGRLASAEIVERPLRHAARAAKTLPLSPPENGGGKDGAQSGERQISFGARVVIRRNGREQCFRIVGIDEADASHGLISFRAPLAAAIMSARAGDIIDAPAPLGEIEIVSVE